MIGKFPRTHIPETLRYQVKLAAEKAGPVLLAGKGIRMFKNFQLQDSKRRLETGII